MEIERAKRKNGDSRDAVRRWRRHQQALRARQRVAARMKKS